MTSYKDYDPDVQPFRSSFAHQGREAPNVRSELALDRHDDTVGDPLPVRTSRRLEADRRRAVGRATADRRLIRPVVLRGDPRPPRDQRADLRHRVGHPRLPARCPARVRRRHVAAIDNTTRKLVADGQRPVSVGLFFSLGHSTVVFAMALFVALGARSVSTLVSDDSDIHQTLGVIGTSVPVVFLIIIGLINLAALMGSCQGRREAQTGAYDEDALEDALNSRGAFARLLRPAMKAIKRPGPMYPLGSCSVSGSTPQRRSHFSSSPGLAPRPGLPWYAVMVLPLLFASGMRLF